MPVESSRSTAAAIACVSNAIKLGSDKPTLQYSNAASEAALGRSPGGSIEGEVMDPSEATRNPEMTTAVKAVSVQSSDGQKDRLSPHIGLIHGGYSTYRARRLGRVQGTLPLNFDTQHKWTMRWPRGCKRSVMYVPHSGVHSFPYVNRQFAQLVRREKVRSSPFTTLRQPLWTMRGRR